MQHLEISERDFNRVCELVRDAVAMWRELTDSHVFEAKRYFPETDDVIEWAADEGIDCDHHTVYEAFRAVAEERGIMDICPVEPALGSMGEKESPWTNPNGTEGMAMLPFVYIQCRKCGRTVWKKWSKNPRWICHGCLDQEGAKQRRELARASI